MASQVALVVKNTPANAGDSGSIPGSGKSSGEENGKPLQYSCLESLMDIGAWGDTVHRVAESDMTGHTHCHTYMFLCIHIEIHKMDT